MIRSPHAVDRRHLAAVGPRGRWHHPVRPVPGAELRPVVSAERREKRPSVLLPAVPDAGVAARG